MRKHIFKIFLGIMAILMVVSPVMAYEKNATQTIDVYGDISSRDPDADVTVYKADQTIRIEAVTPGSPMPEEDTIVLQNGKGKFVMEYDEPGEHEYKIYQVKGEEHPDEKTTVEYDDRVYSVYVYVEDKDGVLISKVVLALEGKDGKEPQKPDKCSFVNFVKTGVTDSMVIYIIMGVAAVGLIAVLLFLRKKNEKEEEDAEGAK